MKAPVNKIIKFSNVDGPGNRTSVFFQKCNFQCRFCHNPETINLCQNCGKCVKGCPKQALSIENGKVLWQEDKCIGCDQCIIVCPYSASPRVKLMSPNEVLTVVRQTRPYIKGITVSGGECSLRADFLKQLFPKVQKLNLTTFMDSNGSYDYRNDQALLACTDAVMLDVKAVDPDFHQYLCHSDNTMVLENLDYLLSIDKLYEVRTIIFPYEDEQNEATVRYVASHIGDKCIYKLIKYRPFGVKESYQKELGDLTTSDEYIQPYLQLALQTGAKKAIIT